MRDLEELKKGLTGPVASVSTPFSRDGSIDFPSLRNIVDFVIDGGSKTVLLTYGDSLYTIVTDKEVAEITRFVAEQTAGRALVVAADRIWATPKEVEFARFARGVGADVLMALPPDWAQSCTMETLIEHYAAVAEQIPVMVVTNYLELHPIKFGFNLFKTLVDCVPGVVSIKDDVCGEFARKMGIALHGRVSLISGGQKQNHMNALPYGCDGYLSTFARFKPEIARKYWDAIQSGDYGVACGIITKYDIPLFDFIASFAGGFDAAVHGCLELFGVAERWRRKPYYSLDDAEMERLADFFQRLRLL